MGPTGDMYQFENDQFEKDLGYDVKKFLQHPANNRQLAWPLCRSAMGLALLLRK